MNESPEREELDDVLLDRLVDGELDEKEYRSVLAALETRPDGWRRCALAFLEAQAWGRDLRRVFDEGSKQAAKPILPTRRRWNWTYGGLITLASAASFTLAFLLAPAVFNQRQQNPAMNDFAANTERLKPNVFDDPQGGALEIQSPESNAGFSLPPRQYQLVVHENGESKRIEMPVFAADDPRASLLMNEQATMPRELMQRLQRMGYEVDRQRQWTPVVHQDQGTVIVPIEELRITPVSGRSYQ